MDVNPSFFAFLGISALVIATPGPDTALTVRNTLVGGERAGRFTALGVSAGQIVWAVATSFGLLALLLASEPVFHAIELLGAVYLIVLGGKSLRSAFLRSLQTGRDTPPASRANLTDLQAFCQGVVNNLANPKMAVFFASILPQVRAGWSRNAVSARITRRRVCRAHISVAFALRDGSLQSRNTRARISCSARTRVYRGARTHLFRRQNRNGRSVDGDFVGLHEVTNEAI